MTADSIDRTLQRARGALTPSSSERAHVLERLGVRFPELASSAGLNIESNLQPRPERLPSSEPRAGFWRTIRGTGAGGAALGAGLVAAGFIAGLALKAELSPPRDPPAPQAAAPVTLAASDDTLGKPAPEQPPPDQSERAPTASELPGSTGPSTPRDRRTRPLAPTPRAAAEPAPPAPPQQLEQELLALQRAERALRSDNAELALAVLAELDARHPRPLLGEERTATRSMASCQANIPGAIAAARTFLDSHPRSVYGDRIRASCQLETGVRNPSGSATDPAPRDIDGR
jgi:hypothetical protein